MLSVRLIGGSTEELFCSNKGNLVLCDIQVIRQHGKLVALLVRYEFIFRTKLSKSFVKEYERYK